MTDRVQSQSQQIERPGSASLVWQVVLIFSAAVFALVAGVIVVLSGTSPRIDGAYAAAALVAALVVSVIAIVHTGIRKILMSRALTEVAVMRVAADQHARHAKEHGAEHELLDKLAEQQRQLGDVLRELTAQADRQHAQIRDAIGTWYGQVVSEIHADHENTLHTLGQPLNVLTEQVSDLTQLLVPIIAKEDKGHLMTLINNDSPAERANGRSTGRATPLRP